LWAQRVQLLLYRKQSLINELSGIKVEIRARVRGDARRGIWFIFKRAQCHWQRLSRQGFQRMVFIPQNPVCWESLSETGPYICVKKLHNGVEFVRKPPFRSWGCPVMTARLSEDALVQSLDKGWQSLVWSSQFKSKNNTLAPHVDFHALLDA
jgi:hypothetical protein